MMPGVTFNNGGNAGSGYNSQVTGTNNGPAGSFSANGTQPYGSTDVLPRRRQPDRSGQRRNAGCQHQPGHDRQRQVPVGLLRRRIREGPGCSAGLLTRAAVRSSTAKAYLYARNSGSRLSPTTGTTRRSRSPAENRILSRRRTSTTSAATSAVRSSSRISTTTATSCSSGLATST